MRYKLVFNVPSSHADHVRNAIAVAGAGHVGNYCGCSFSVKGMGRFTPVNGADPHIGRIGQSETVEEEQIQVTVDGEVLENVLIALRQSHPYEEIDPELYPLLDVNMPSRPEKIR